MLSSDEIDELTLALVATAEILGHTLSAAAAELMAGDLADYPQPVIADALRACRQELTGKLSLAAILERIRAADGRPADDEAWALALRAYDERESVMLTDEIRIAMDAARPIMATGDQIGARMAFKKRYLRELDLARRAARPAAWALSLGHSPELREQAVSEAARQGLLTAGQATRLLAQIAMPALTQDGQAIAGLLTGSGTQPSPQLRERWQQLRRDVLQAKADNRRRRAEERAREKRESRERFEAEKARQLQAAADRQAGREVEHHG